MYTLFSKTTNTGLPALYCRVVNQPEDSKKCVRLFVIAPHGLVVCNSNLKFIVNSVNRFYFLEWLNYHNVQPINGYTTRQERLKIEKILKLFENKLK